MPEPIRRVDRAADALRPVDIQRGYLAHVPGSVLISCGETRVLTTAIAVDDVPPHRLDSGGGWVTAEYNMMPGSTPDRQRRGTNSRATEIQRLIGRSLRAAVDLHKLPGVQITCDCDVMQADGGTRTAAITGAYVALHDCLAAIAGSAGAIGVTPIDRVLRRQIAAISVGIVDGEPRLDLDYREDAAADVDMNIVRTGDGRFIEVQGTAESAPFDADQLQALLALATKGTDELIGLQRDAIGAM
jgi:ribonuclease PH